MDKNFLSIIRSKQFIDDDLFELQIENFFAAKNYAAGQYFKLQNYKKYNKPIFEPIAVTPYAIEGVVLKFIIKIVGQSTKLASYLGIGEEVGLMGPCGESYGIFAEKKVALLSFDSYSYALASYSQALLEAGCTITHLIYCSGNIAKIELLPGQVRIVQAIEDIDLNEGRFDKVIISGPCSFMREICNVSDIDFSKVQSIYYAPLQCMLHGVCGKCLTKISDGKFEFLCKKNILPLSTQLIESISSKHREHALAEKLYI